MLVWLLFGVLLVWLVKPEWSAYTHAGWRTWHIRLQQANTKSTVVVVLSPQVQHYYHHCCTVLHCTACLEPRMVCNLRVHVCGNNTNSGPKRFEYNAANNTWTDVREGMELVTMLAEELRHLGFEFEV